MPDLRLLFPVKPFARLFPETVSEGAQPAGFSMNPIFWIPPLTLSVYLIKKQSNWAVMNSMKILKRTFLFLLRLYQAILSPDHNQIGMKNHFIGCRYFPSCSEYAHEATRQYGLFRGSIVSLKRIIRCHPFANGGYDPVSNIEQLRNEWIFSIHYILKRFSVRYLTGLFFCIRSHSKTLDSRSFFSRLLSVLRLFLCSGVRL